MIPAPRKICVVTGTRAEYGLLFWLMKAIQGDPKLVLQLIVTGTHLDSRYGRTVEVIEADGFSPDAEIELPLEHPGAAMGKCLSGIADALQKLQPDIVVLLGDRYETFSAAAAATLVNIPIAHIHGGECTEGAIDDAFRHAITKMAHLHFTAAAEYQERVVQMGEAPERVFLVGAPGIDNIVNLNLLSAEELSDALKFNLGKSYFVLTIHPATAGAEEPEIATRALLAAIDKFNDSQIVITGVNADPGRDVVADLLNDYAKADTNRVLITPSLGQQRYLSAVKHAALVIGNSSSGLIEAPALNTPTVNIGSRQNGRLKADSVIDCPPRTEAISSAIEKALDPAFKIKAAEISPPYGAGGASNLILGGLKNVDLERVIPKVFFDMNKTN